ncbi:MAG: hypothetical protein WCH62_09085, partial [Candidatus Omnitrophota bacterium]
VVYKYFEGYWDVRKINGKWMLWAPRIDEEDEPSKEWFLDTDRITEIEKFLSENKYSDDCKYDMYKIAQEPGNEDLSLKVLYVKAKEKNKSVDQ